MCSALRNYWPRTQPLILRWRRNTAVIARMHTAPVAKKVLQSLFCCPAGYYACVRAADQRKRKFTLHCIISSLALTVGQPHASRRNRRAGNRKATTLLSPSTSRKYVCYVPSQLKWCMQSLQGGASGLALSLDYIDLTISAVRLVLLGQL